MTQPPDDRLSSTGGSDRYEIRVRGHLAGRWEAWFDGLSITNQDDGTALLAGDLVDQSALHGLLHKLRDTGLPLVSVTQLTSPPEPNAPKEKP